MEAILLIPIMLGILAGLLSNYLADTLPYDSGLPRPVCAKQDCRQTLRWADYLLLRRCPKCGKQRWLRAAIVSIFMVAASLFIWLNPPQKMGYTLALLVLAYLITVTIIDFEHRLILRPLSIAGLLLCGAAGYLLHGWVDTLIGGGFGFMLLFILYLFGMLFTRLRAKRLGQDPKESEEALGSGDVTLAAILGLLMGWPLIWFGLLLGALLAGGISLIIVLVLLISGRYKQQAFMVFIPLGPAFITSAVVMTYLPSWVAGFLPD